MSLTTVTLPSQVKGAGLSKLSSVYNGTVTTDTSATFYIKYNISSYGFATIVISPSDLYLSVATAVTGNEIYNTGDSYSYNTSIVMTPTEADCENADESTDGGINCMFLVTVSADSYTYTSLDEISFKTYGYVGQVFSTSNGAVTSFSSIPKGYSMFYLGTFQDSYSYSGDSYTYYYYDVTISTNDSLAVYVYEAYDPTSYSYSSATYSSDDKVFSSLYAATYIFQVVSSSSSSSSASSFDISVVTNSYTYDYSYYDEDGDLSAGAIVGIVLGSLFGIVVILLGIWFVTRVSAILQSCLVLFLNFSFA
jgi:hypothetical protein